MYKRGILVGNLPNRKGKGSKLEHMRTCGNCNAKFSPATHGLEHESYTWQRYTVWWNEKGIWLWWKQGVQPGVG
jgi:hypothetical protein